MYDSSKEKLPHFMAGLSVYVEEMTCDHSHTGGGWAGGLSRQDLDIPRGKTAGTRVL